MSLVDEYREQYEWRDWKKAMALCPIEPGQRVLDLGCGPGDIAGALQARGAAVTGIDGNPGLIAAARESYPQCDFKQQNISCLKLEPGEYDGLWCSFTAAYFTDFATTFAAWSRYLKAGAWVCVIETDDLLGHVPLAAGRRDALLAFYEEADKSGRYDFMSGHKLRGVLEARGCHVREHLLDDRELSFNGPAEPNVQRAWARRFERMQGLRRFLGEDFEAFRAEFLECITSPTHQSLCKVFCCVT